jgi:hypothetical protein
MKRLGRRRRVFACGVIALGFLTIFAPLITTSPAVMNQTRWSVLDIGLKVADGALPRVADTFVWTLLFEIASIYVLILLALGTVCLFPMQRPLGVISAIGIVITYTTWQFGPMKLEMMFYGHFRASDWPVKFDQLMGLLLLVMLALLVISRYETLDPENLGLKTGQRRLAGS